MRIIAATVVAAASLAWPAEAQKEAAAQPAPPAVTSTSAPQDDARRISREEAIKLVDAKKAVFVDVRSKEQFDLGHIKGALHIPEAEIVARAKTIRKGRMIITYCA